MVIQCSKKLLDEVKAVHEEADEEPIFCWQANLITVDQRKTIVLINDSNRYVVVIFGVKAKHKKDIRNVIKTAIRKTLIAEGIKKEAVDRYIQCAHEVIFSKTKSKSMISKLSQTCETVRYFAEDFEAGGLSQSQMSRRLSTYPVMQSNELIFPNERMYEDIGRFYGKTIFQLKAVIVNITLNLKKYKVAQA